MPRPARRHARQCLRGQAQPRLLRAVRQRGLRGPRAAARRRCPATAADPRRQARRHGQHVSGVRARALRRARRRRDHRQRAARRRQRRALAHPARPRRVHVARTSNPGATDFLDHARRPDGRPLYQRIVDVAQGWDPGGGTIGFVVGATAPDAVADVRRRAPSAPLLLPGVGAQGGDSRPRSGPRSTPAVGERSSRSVAASRPRRIPASPPASCATASPRCAPAA